MKVATISQILDYLLKFHIKIETHSIDDKNIPAFRGVYFVACQPHLLYVGSSSNIAATLLSHESKKFYACADKLTGNKPLTVTCVRIDDLEIAENLVQICVAEMNPLINIRQIYLPGVKDFQELIKLVSDRYYAMDILFNGFLRFNPCKLTKQFLIYVTQYSLQPDIDVKLLAYAPFWEHLKDPRSKEIPPHFSGGDITLCRSMIDAELKVLYAVRGYGQERLQKVLKKNRDDRQEYIKSLLKHIEQKSFLDSVKDKSFEDFLKFYCINKPNLQFAYTDLHPIHKVQMLLQIIETVDHPKLLAVVKQELRNYF